MQKTLNSPASLEGPTLWEKGSSRVRIYPAEPDTGIALFQISGRRKNRFPLSPHYASVENHRVVLSYDNKKLAFVEHLLAGLWSTGIDNARVEVTGSELPFFDGSALAYVQAVRQAGVKLQDKPRRRKSIVKPVLIWCQGGFLHLAPARKLSITYIFTHRGTCVLRLGDIGSQFASQIAPARTFAAGPFPDFQYPFDIRSAGRLSYPYPPRFPDEMARHKVLDLLGDLALMGARMPVRVIAYRTGHYQTHMALKHLAKEAIDA